MIYHLDINERNNKFEINKKLFNKFYIIHLIKLEKMIDLIFQILICKWNLNYIKFFYLGYWVWFNNFKNGQRTK
jgi:hypothetical protein